MLQQLMIIRYQFWFLKKKTKPLDVTTCSCVCFNIMVLKGAQISSHGFTLGKRKSVIASKFHHFKLEDLFDPVMQLVNFHKFFKNKIQWNVPPSTLTTEVRKNDLSVQILSPPKPPFFLKKLSRSSHSGKYLEILVLKKQTLGPVYMCSTVAG